MYRSIILAFGFFTLLSEFGYAQSYQPEAPTTVDQEKPINQEHPKEEPPHQIVNESEPPAMRRVLVRNPIRFEISPTIITPYGDLEKGVESSFGLGFFLGYEIASFGSLLVTTGFRQSTVFWTMASALGDQSLTTLNFQAVLRASLKGGRFRPFISVGAGIEHNVPDGKIYYDQAFYLLNSKTGFGVDINAGSYVMINKNVEIGFSVDIHPAINQVAQVSNYPEIDKIAKIAKASYFGFSFNMAFRF